MEYWVSFKNLGILLFIGDATPGKLSNAVVFNPIRVIARQACY